MMELNKLIFKHLIYYPCMFLKKIPLRTYQDLLEDSQYYSQEQIQDIQLAKLKQLIKYSVKNVPYYSESYSGIDVEGLNSLDSLIGLPLIDKKVLRNTDGFLLSKGKISYLTRRVTGGSTGEHTVIWKTADALAQELAATWRGYSWAGVTIGDRQGRLWGIPHSQKDQFRAQLIDFMGHRKRCSAFAINDTVFEKYTCTLEKFNPDYLYGYLSMLEEYSDYFQRNSIKPPFHVKAIFSTSEVLSDPQREKIQKVFSAKVFNEYGSAELGTVAHECKYGSLHCSEENMIVEILNKDDSPCAPGEVGELVVTELNNIVMPLIRYRTNDFASFGVEKCKCGRSLLVIDKIYGRGWDFISNIEGRRFHPAFFLYVFEDAKMLNLGVRGFQIIQKSLDDLVVKIVPDLGYGEDTRKYIHSRISQDFSPSIKISFVEVEKIDRLPSGKRQLVIGLQVNSEKT